MAQRQAYDVARLTYDSTINASRIVELAPTDQQVLFEKLLNAVVATGASTQVYTLDKRDMSMCVIASSTSDGGIFTFEGSPDGTNWGSLTSIDSAGTASATQAVPDDGTFFFDITNVGSVKYVRANLGTRSDGTFTVYFMAKA